MAPRTEAERTYQREWHRKWRARNDENMDVVVGPPCRKCGSLKRMRNGQGKTRCAECHARKNREAYQANPALVLAKNRAWRERRRLIDRARGIVYRYTRHARTMYKNAQARARAQGVPFTITEADLVIPERCPVLGIVLRRGDRVTLPCSPSLDKIRPELGYVPGNVIVMSHLANTIKRDADSKTVRRVADWMEAQGL